MRPPAKTTTVGLMFTTTAHDSGPDRRTAVATAGLQPDPTRRTSLVAASVLITLSAAACGSVALDVDVDDTAPTATEAPSTERAVPNNASPESTLQQRVQTALDRSAALIPSSASQSLTILTGDAAINVATGDAEPDSTFRIASVTKTYTAAAVMRLVELLEIDLDDSLVEAGADPDLTDILRRDDYAVEEITVAQLLNHTSGLADYADNAADAADGPFKDAVIADPLRAWTPSDQIEFAVDHHDPVGAAGEQYFYSDTGYVLLGTIVEEHTGLDYAGGMRHLLRFDDLGLENTYVEKLEDPRDGPAGRISQYLGPILMDDFDPSFDLFGGGGIVANTDDIAGFYRALGRGEVFDDGSTFDVMTSLQAPAPAPDARGGVVAGKIDGVDCWYHTGFWGVLALTCPDVDLTIAHTINQADPGDQWDVELLMSEIIEATGAIPGS